MKSTTKVVVFLFCFSRRFGNAEF